MSRTRGRTAFERTVLPGLARWFVQQVVRYQPDFIVPTEAKGARLLEIVMAYARDELGTPIEVPVLYRIALPYVDPVVLRRSRLLIFDDALCTGANLRRHHDWIEALGVRDLPAIACIADAEQEGKQLADCYRLVSSEQYREYVWLLTELVVARGLPPEVDHKMFALRMSTRVPLVWEGLGELSRFGSLTLDEPAKAGRLSGMTLHFPNLPGATICPPSDAIRLDGVHKVRLYPDPSNGATHVVPVSFPSLRLPAGTPSVLEREEARRLVRSWTAREDSIGELLVDEAHTLLSETVFRMLSTCAEVELTCGFARALAGIFPSEQISLDVDRELVHWLYGPEGGERIADRIDALIAEALANPAQIPATPEAPTPNALPLDQAVVDTTRQLARMLKEQYEREAQTADPGSAERVGMSFVEMLDALPGVDRLLISRCCGYGLAMTTLVPWVDVKRHADGSVELVRRYRVSEHGRKRGRFASRDDIDKRIAEQTIALIAYYLQARSERCPAGVSEDVLVPLVGILGRLVLEKHNLALHIEPGRPNPQIALRRDANVVSLSHVTSQWFSTADGDIIVPTERFKQRLGGDAQMHIALDDTFVAVEGRLARLLQLVESECTQEQILSTLRPWAMSTDRRLGLTHVRHDLDEALEALVLPLDVMLRGEPHESVGEAYYDAIREIAVAAKDKLDLLTTDWSSVPKGVWDGPFTEERTLRESLGAPTGVVEIYGIADALTVLVSAVSLLVGRLEQASVDAWTQGERADGVESTAHAVIVECRLLERTMTSLRAPHETSPSSLRGHALIEEAAECLLDAIALLRAFASATSGTFGSRVGSAPEPDGMRSDSVLFVDLAGSSDHAATHPPTPHGEWVDGALNLASQWARAFGGWEHRQRQGDDAWLAFDDRGDPAVLCAALIQQHVRALRSLGDDEVSWRFHAAIDDGRIVDGDAGNATANCINRAAKLAKHTELELEPDAVLVTDEARQLCSPALHSEDDALMPSLGRSVEVPGGAIVPQLVDTAAVVRGLAERMRQAARRIEQTAATMAAEQPPAPGMAVDPGDQDAETTDEQDASA